MGSDILIGLLAMVSVGVVIPICYKRGFWAGVVTGVLWPFLSDIHLGFWYMEKDEEIAANKLKAEDRANDTPNPKS